MRSVMNEWLFKLFDVTPADQILRDVARGTISSVEELRVPEDVRTRVADMIEAVGPVVLTPDVGEKRQPEPGSTQEPKAKRATAVGSGTQESTRSKSSAAAPIRRTRPPLRIRTVGKRHRGNSIVQSDSD